jgi:hypothetical protein
MLRRQESQIQGEAYIRQTFSVERKSLSVNIGQAYQEDILLLTLNLSSLGLLGLPRLID